MQLSEPHRTSVRDKLTNALDKLGNAIKDGDVSKSSSSSRGILEGVEDKLGDGQAILFERCIDDAKRTFGENYCLSQGEAAANS